jgi:hypothetical protein
MNIERELELKKHYEQMRDAITEEIDKHIDIGNGRIVSKVYGWRDESSEQYEFNPEKFIEAYNNMMDFLETDYQYFEEDSAFVTKIWNIFNTLTEPLEDKLPELKKLLNERLCHFKI